MPPRKKAAAQRKTARTPITAVRHRDKRANIPTRELQDFVREDEAKPKTVLYPRDPSLDPQLVWKGKDDQDQTDLAVPAVPVYIQEKIQPKAIIEEVRQQAKGAGGEPQAELFADFNGIRFEEMVDFYHHEQNWSNRVILGDSLLVMTSLAEKEGLKGKVQTIYLDPPYGIKFGSNWQVSTRKRDVKDGKVEDATRQPEQIRAFRDTWEYGIHSYLAYLRDRLVVARELLTETGSIFVQIGDENVHLVRCVMDEVFGSENIVSQITFRTTTGRGEEYLSSASNFILWYAKSYGDVTYRQLLVDKSAGDTGAELYSLVRLPDGSTRRISSEERDNLGLLPAGARLFRPDNLMSQRPLQGNDVREFVFEGRKYSPGSGVFKTDLPGLNMLALAGRLWPTRGGTLQYVRFLDDFPAMPINNVWSDTGTGSFTEPKVYVVQTNAKVIQRCLLMTTDPGDLVLDPTCGSGTTAYVAEQWGRRWITIDTSRVALALARTRLMAAKYPYYLLADSPEGVKKEAGLTGKMPPDYKTDGDIRKGFVYERVRHVTLKSIANNPDIREGMSRAEIDAAIARHAETEILYDKPYEDPKRIRVSGPFTVESLSPHRILSGDEPRPATEDSARRDATAGQFEVMILDNLRKAGVQNTVKNERLVFDRLEPHAGLWLQGAGEYTEKAGAVRRVAVSIGPEHGTVGPEQVKEAAKEAVKGVGFDVLVMCGFAFDPHASETAREFLPAATGAKEMAVAESARQYGKLTILLARMNPDLAMGDELLKKTGAGNLFMVFGEPDIEIGREKDGRLVVEVKGVDVYDPTTGAVRNASTDDIACWFVDTNYNGESFFVRHAYFTGDQDPYERLRRALRAEVDEAAWASLYCTKSRPFDRPGTGRIAVKVINHYGDEVLKVYDV
jgi:adenine-specific DNA-methyltransferase